MSVVVNVSFFPLLMLNMIRIRRMSTFWVDVKSHKALFSIANLPHSTIRILAFQVLFITASFIC
eukprot:4159368-Prorocentrum_lima.AAC.1